jgi:hypothetical protein
MVNCKPIIDVLVVKQRWYVSFYYRQVAGRDSILTIHFEQKLPICTASGFLIPESVLTKREDDAEIRFFASLKSSRQNGGCTTN